MRSPLVVIQTDMSLLELKLQMRKVGKTLEFYHKPLLTDTDSSAKTLGQALFGMPNVVGCKGFKSIIRFKYQEKDVVEILDDFRISTLVNLDRDNIFKLIEKILSQMKLTYVKMK